MSFSCIFSFLYSLSLLTWIISKINQKKSVELNLRIYELNVRLEDIWKTIKKDRQFLYMKFILSNETLNVLIIPFKH